LDQQQLDLNSLGDLKKYFATEERPVLNQEFVEFWQSLSEEEKNELRTAKLS